MMNHGPTRLVFDSSVQRRGDSSMLFLGGAAGGDWGAAAAAEDVSRRRPFYTAAGDELWDEDYYDEQQTEKKRRLSPEQVDLLEKSFEVENKLEPERKSELAKKLGLPPRQVAVWFQNRRARWKTKQLEHDFDRLKSSYDSLLVDHHSLLKDNDLLRGQVVMLMEKLQQKEAADLAMGLQKEDQDHSGGDHEAKLIRNSSSTGSGGSAVLGQGIAQFVDSSGESHIQDSCYHHVDLVGNGIHSDEDDGSDEGCSYLPAVFQEHNQPEEASQMNYWFWD